MSSRSWFAVLIGVTILCAPLSAAVYVSNVDDDTISVIDPATNTVIQTISVGNEPRDLASTPSGDRIYVPNRHSDDVSVISTATNTVSATIADASFDEPYAAAVTSDGTEVWVVNKKGGGSTTGSVTIISVATNMVTATIDDPCFSSPEGIALNAVSARAYVVNRESNTVCVVNTTTRTVLASVDVGSRPRYAVVTPDGASVYVSGSPIAKINTATNTPTLLADTAGRNMDINPAGTKVYVARKSSGQVLIINTATDGVTALTLTGASNPSGTYAVAVEPVTGRAYVTEEDDDEVYVIDTATDTQVTGAGLPIAVGRTPRAIAAAAAMVMPPAAPEAIPTLGRWGIVILILLIAGVGLYFRNQGQSRHLACRI